MPALGEIDVEPLKKAAERAVAFVRIGRDRRAAAVGAVSVDSPFRIASLSKPITAVATVVAARRAGVDLGAPILEILPSLRGDCAADQSLTVADVLSQTSGLAATVTAGDVAALGSDDEVFLESARLVLRGGSARPRGERWEYYNGNYFLVGAVLEALAGACFEVAVANLVLRPWGLSSTTFTASPDLTPGIDKGSVVPAPAYPRGRRPSGGVCSTATDLLTFGQCLLDDGWVLEAVRTARTRPGDRMQYGLGWALGPSGQMYLNGRLAGYRSALMLIPAHDFVGVVLAADSSALPAAARVLSACQEHLTGDDLTGSIDTFAA